MTGTAATTLVARCPSGHVLLSFAAPQLPRRRPLTVDPASTDLLSSITLAYVSLVPHMCFCRAITRLSDSLLCFDPDRRLPSPLPPSALVPHSAMRPTLLRRTYNEFRSPWERRNAWRSQYPYNMDMTTGYYKYGRHAIAIYATYWLWREVVKYGPLRPYVNFIYGEEKEHGHHHGEEDGDEVHMHP